MAIRYPIIFLAVLGVCATAAAADWPQWMGPKRDGVWSETGILEKFPAEGPRKLWSMPVYGGYAGPAVAGGKVFVHDYQRTDGNSVNNPSIRAKLKGNERVVCFDEATGKELWVHTYDCPYEVSYPSGPRCTPTVQDGRVYTLGSMGHFFCLSAADGKVLWSKNFPKDFGGEVPIWGFSGHPLVHGNLVICLVGGKDSLLVAFDKATGQERWRALSAKDPGYCPPRVIQAGGQPQLIHWYPNDLASLNPETGELFWKFPLKPLYEMTIMSPQLGGDTLFAGGIGGAALAVKLDATKPAAKELWRGAKTNAVYPVNATPLIVDGVIYGVDQPGVFRAVALNSGKRLWASMLPVTGKDIEETNVGSGTAFLVKNGERYFLFGETGHLIIAKLSPEKYQEVSRFKILEPSGEAFGRKVVWSHPAFANGCVYARNDNEIVCYSLKAR